MISFAGRTILVVDDEPGFRELMADEFSAYEANVLMAENGAVAFAMASSQKIDAIVTDIRMPGGNGIDLLDRLKAVNCEIPVTILITGFSDLTLEDAYHKGAEAVFSKPFNLDLLVECTHRSLMPREERWGHPLAADAHDFKIEIAAASLDDAKRTRVINIGRGGMFVAIAGRLPSRDKRVHFHLRDPGSGFQGIGICRWTRGDTDSPLPRGAGIEFQDLEPDALAALLRGLKDVESIPFIPKA